jgi:aminoglycoside/choline kinase family phosphotransferase
MQFLQVAGWAGGKQVPIAGDASNRRYTRITRRDGTSAILMDAPPNRNDSVAPFVEIANHLTAAGLSAPRIYHTNIDHGFLLIEDLGDDLFARMMARDPGQSAVLYRAATDLLIALHKAPVMSLPVADAEWLSGMLAPVFEWYVQVASEETSDRLKGLFLTLARTLDSAPKVIALRDYHAENLLWLPDRSGVAQVGLLDFQDAVLGHPAYDLVSVLQDARREVPTEIEREMIARYIAATGCAAGPFETAYALLGAQRNLRILGIFARLCLRDGKAHYLDMIPRVWGYVQRNLAHPELTDLRALINDTLSPPTPQFLEHLKSRCPHTPAL